MSAEIESFINWVRRRSPRAHTWRSYRSDLRAFTEAVGDRSPGKINFRDIDHFIELQSAKGFKPGTINRRLAAIVSFYAFLSSKGAELCCPVLPRRHRLKEPQRLPRPVPQETLRRFFAVVQDVRDRAMFMLMLRGGLRIAEVANLLLTDVYLGDRTPCLIFRGKGSHERTVYLSPQAQGALRAWLAIRPRTSSEHVFVSYRKAGLSTTAIHKRLMHYRGACGVTITAHRLRHTFANDLLGAGMPIPSIQKLMGHRSLDTTQNYVRANDGQVRAEYFAACRKVEGWHGRSSSLEIQAGIEVKNPPSAGLFDPLKSPGFDPSHYALRLPAWLTRRLEEAYQLRRSHWRAERVIPNSRGYYSRHVQLWRFFSEERGVREVSELTREHVLDFVDHRLKAGCSAAGVNGDLSALRTFLIHLQEEGERFDPSLLNIPRLKQADSLPRFIPLDQIVRLRDEIEQMLLRAEVGKRRNGALLTRAVFYLLWQGGLRLGEAGGLLMSDLDLPAKKLYIRDGKGRRDRTVYLSEVAVQALKEYLAARSACASDRVFLYRDLPLGKDLIRRRLKTIGCRIGVAVLPHRLRHTCATQLLNAGCKLTSIQQLLGHKNVNTTMIYARIFDETVSKEYLRAVGEIEP